MKIKKRMKNIVQGGPLHVELSRKTIVVIIAFVVLLGCLTLFKAFKAAMISKFMPNPNAAVVVTSIKAKSVFWEPQVHTVGSVKARQSVDIAPEVSGRVTKIAFTSGQHVKAGDILVQLNPDVLTAQLESAKATYDFNKVTYERQFELYSQGVGQQQAVDAARADRDEAKATVGQIEAQLNQLSIQAPFDGVLGLRYVNIGQYVSPGDVLVNLQSTNPMEVDFTVPEVFVDRVKVGLPLTVNSLAYGGRAFAGNIFAINSQIDIHSRGLGVRGSVENEKGLLVPDMFVDILVHLKGGKNVIVVPQTSINYSPIGDYLYLIENAKVRKQYVSVGERRAGEIAVTEGLTVDQEVVGTGQLKLYDGAAIEIQTLESDKS